MQRHFARLGLNTRPDGSPADAFGRFEAAAPNDLWTGDALHGPDVAGRKTYLFAFIDDHSRALVGYRWGLSEDTVRLEAALRSALAARGVPRPLLRRQRLGVHVSSSCCGPWPASGSAWCTSDPATSRPREDRTSSSRRCASSSSSRSKPGRRRCGRAQPAVQRLGRDRLSPPGPHRDRPRRPSTLLAAGPPTLPTPAALHEAFLWSETRTVTKTATISLHGNTFEVDAALVGRRVEVVFDPFALETVEIRFQGRADGRRRPSKISRHSHPQARPDAAACTGALTGIDYLGLVAARREAELAEAHQLLPALPPRCRAAGHRRRQHGEIQR